MPVGLTIIAFSQAFVLAQKSSAAHSEAENLAKKLKNYAANLEKIVSERTKKIEYQKNSIESAAVKLRQTNMNLVKLADFKKNMTAMLIHDLKNPLNNIIGFTSLQESLDPFKDVIHTSGWNMLNMVENLLDIEQSATQHL